MRRSDSYVSGEGHILMSYHSQEKCRYEFCCVGKNVNILKSQIFPVSLWRGFFCLFYFCIKGFQPLKSKNPFFDPCTSFWPLSWVNSTSQLNPALPLLPRSLQKEKGALIHQQPPCQTLTQGAEVEIVSFLHASLMLASVSTLRFKQK